MSELKPCPFCGESKLLYSGGCGFRYDDDDNQIRLFRVHCRTCKGRTGLFESLDEAVEAWNRRTNSTTIQPPALGTNLASLGTDCISREQAIKAIEEEWDGCCSEYPATQIIYDTTEAIERLPIIQPRRGKWIDKGERGDWEWQADGRGKHWHEWECNICHHYFAERSFFCPHCGADMRGEQYG